MYRIDIVRFGNGPDITIYDQSQMTEASLYSPALALELNEAGSLTFTLPITHPYISELQPIETYIRALKNGIEVFYGRILERSGPTLLGQVSFECEGELSFLLDSEVTPYGVDEEGKQIIHRMSAEAFFRWCIDQHNACVQDSRRTFTVGTVNATWKDEEQTYSISSYTQTKSIIESKILGVYGGFIRTYPHGSGQGRMIDWIQNYEHINYQTIAIGVNVEEQSNSIDGNDIFTAIRPVGDNNLVLSSGEIIPLFSSWEMDRYGLIVKSITFSGVTDETTLQARANAYVSRMQASLFKSSSIRMVDMHYIDGVSLWVWVGDRFTNIQGLEGEEMIVASMNIDFENPQNDTLSLKNRRSLDPDASSSEEEEKINDRKSDSYAKNTAKSAARAAQYFKTIKETGNDLEISADNVWMHGKTLTQNYDEIRQTMNWFESISSRANQSEQIIDQQTQRINNHDVIVRPIEGTAIVKDPYFIANVAGQFEIWEDQTTGKKTVHLISGSELRIDDENGIAQNVGDRIAIAYNKSTSLDEFFTAETYEGGTTWTMKNKIAGIVGMYRIETTQVEDPNHPGQYIEHRELVFIEGGGYKVERDGVEYGLYDQGNLTGGLIVEKVNDDVQAQLRADKVTIWGTKNLDNLVGHWEEYTVVNGVDEFNQPIYTTGLRYVADAGMRVRRTDENTGITSEFGVYDEGNLTAGVIVQKINGETTTHIRGDKILIGNVEGNDLDSWAADADVAIAGKVAIGTFSALEGRVETLETKYLTTQRLKSTIGDIDQLVVKGIAGSAVDSAAHFNSFNGHSYNYTYKSGQMSLSSDLTDGIYELQILPPSGNTNLYTLQSRTIKEKASNAPWTDVGTFSRAVSNWTDTWNGNAVLSVKANPQNQTHNIGFGASYGTNDVDLEIVGNGNPTKDTIVASAIVVPIKVQQLNSGQTAPTERYTKNITFSVSGLLQSITPTTGGNKVPSNDKIGFSNVNIQVEAGASVITWDSTNKYFYNYGYAYLGGSSSAAAESTKRTSSTLSLSTGSWGSTKKASRTIKVQFGNSDILTETISCSATAGASAITWDSTNKYFYNYGYAYLNGSSEAAAESAKRTSSTLSLDTGSWSNGSRIVKVQFGTSDILSSQISIPAVDATYWEQNGHRWRTRLTIGGAYKYSDYQEMYTKTEYDNNNTAGWVTGYDTAVGTISTDANPSGTLEYGTNYVIRVQYTDRQLGTKRTAKTIQFTTPSDRWATGYDACAGTISTDTTPDGTLAYNTSYRVNVQYTNRSSGTKTTVKTLQFTTPSCSLDTGSWASGNRLVQLMCNGSAVAQSWISVPGVESGSTSWENDGHRWRTKITIGGADRYSAYKTMYTQAEYDNNFNDGWYAYYDSSYWETPSSNNGYVCKVPARNEYAKVTWFKISDIIGIWADDFALLGQQAAGDAINAFTSGCYQLCSNGYVASGYYYKFSISAGGKKVWYWFKAG